jgi:predicted RNA-binding protein with PIN domain
MRLVVDGMNVIGSRPDRWWRDRRGAMRRIVASLDRYAHETGDHVTLVLDSRPFDTGETQAPITVRFAPGGPNAGDDEIVRIAEGDAAPETLHVVTSDRELAARVAGLGAHVIPAGEFRARLDRWSAPSGTGRRV